MNIPQASYVEETFAILGYYFPSLIGCAIGTGASWLVIKLYSHFTGHRVNPILKRTCVFLPAALGVIYSISTFPNAYLITALDSEDNLYAESVYTHRFSVDLNTAISMATNEQLSGNVRFYASCKIADLLGGTNYPKWTQVSGQLDQAHQFQTGFGGTNSLTCGFFSPNHQEGPFTVEEIITQRFKAASIK